MATNIYFAASIRGGREDAEIYRQIINMLSRYGVVLTVHIGDSDLSAGGEEGLSDRAIFDRDTAWLDPAEALIAEVTNPSLGVGYEIGRSEKDRKPALCLFRKNGGHRLSAMIAGNPNLKVIYYEKVEELKPAFDEFFRSIRG